MIEAARITTIIKSAMQTFFQNYQSVLAMERIEKSNMYNLDKTGIILYRFLLKLILGFAVSDTQRSYVVVDAYLRKKYQASPGNQEWVTTVKCICADGTTIPPLIIFKGENFVTNWIPSKIPTGWKFSNNSKG